MINGTTKPIRPILAWTAATLLWVFVLFLGSYLELPPGYVLVPLALAVIAIAFHLFYSASNKTIRISIEMRRRLRLFVIALTVPCCALWLAHEIRITHERGRERQWLFERGGRENYRRGGWPLRRLLGDKPSANIFPPSDMTPDEFIRLETLFPEAYIFHPMVGGTEPYDPWFDQLHPETKGQKPAGPRRLPTSPRP